MIFNSKKISVLAALVLGAVGAVNSHAASTYVTFSVDMATNIAAGTFTPGTDTVSVNGTFNGWSAYNLVQVGGSTIYTNTLNDTVDANGNKVQYKFVIDGNNYENTASGQNRAAFLPPTSGASLVLPTPNFADNGGAVTSTINFQVDISQQINLGVFVPGSSSVEVRGVFNSWTGGVTPLSQSSISVSGEPDGSVWTGAVQIATSPAAAEGFKYVIVPGPNWESPDSLSSDGVGNRFFANVSQTLPLVNFSDQAFSLQFCTNVFNVDMTVISGVDTNFDPASVVVYGSFNGWGSGVPMTNDPTGTNPAIFISQEIDASAGTTIYYQFRYNLLTSGSTIYDHLDGVNGSQANRVVVEPFSLTYTNVPAPLFNNAEFNDYILQTIPVQFTVDMTGAVGSDAHVFNPTSDALYLNGQFVGWYAWAGGINPGQAPAGFQMFPVGTSLIYTNTVMIPAGIPIGFAYKYGMDPGGINFGPLDDEAAGGQNHYRVIRATAQNTYVMPTDKFGNQYGEPLFSSDNPTNGFLTIGAASGGSAPVSWLGRPGARLQTTTDLMGGSWQTLTATDGTNWTSGYLSTNGFVSVTNWPAGNKAYFRLIKQ